MFVSWVLSVMTEEHWCRLIKHFNFAKTDCQAKQLWSHGESNKYHLQFGFFMGHKDKIFSKVGFLEIVISAEIKTAKEGAIQTILNYRPPTLNYMRQNTCQNVGEDWIQDTALFHDILDFKNQWRGPDHSYHQAKAGRSLQRTSEKYHLETTVMSLLRLTNTIYFQEWKRGRCFPQSSFIYFLYKEILRMSRKSSSIFSSSSSSSHQMLCKTLWKLGFKSKVNNMWKWQNYFSLLLFSCELIDTRSKHVDIATFWICM